MKAERRSVRGRQALFVLVGLAAAVIMAVLGLWQAQRSVESGAAGVRARAAEPAVPLLDNVRPDGTLADVYGKPVTVTGTYLPDQQLRVVDAAGTVRVLTALEVPDGRVVPVVRGVAPGLDAVPDPPAGVQTAQGLFLPGEGDADSTHGGELGSVRTPLIAQRWPQQVTPGFVTLDAEHAQAQGLAAASVTLPQGEKSLQNGSYAIQWWIFSAFALGMGLKLAYDIGAKERARDEADAAASRRSVDASASSVGGTEPSRR